MRSFLNPRWKTAGKADKRLLEKCFAKLGERWVKVDNHNLAKEKRKHS
jgi:hypothetical protein